MMVLKNKEIVPSAAKGRGVEGRFLYINVGSAIFLCVWRMFRAAPHKEKP